MSPLVQKTWAEVSARLGRNDLPRALVSALISHSISGTELAMGVADSWISPEWPGQQMDLATWILIFRRSTPEGRYLLDEGETRLLADLDEQLTLYRGCWEEYKLGMSWTTDRDMANWFAHRFDIRDNVGVLYTVTVPRELVLATFDRRGELEVVLDCLTMKDTYEIEPQAVSATVGVF
jgi:hypothetical protein